MTVEFFKNDFGLTGRETVALLGAHTMGRLHFDVSLFRYVWTSRGTHMFNNHYYRQSLTLMNIWINVCDCHCLAGIL